MANSFDRVFMGAAGTSGESDPPVSGYTAWYRADTVTASGADVSQWDDQSGNDFHMTRWDASYSPQLVSSDSNFNGKPSIDLTAQTGSTMVRFNTAGGANTGSTTTSIFSNGRDDFSIFAVYRGSSAQSAYGYSEIIGDYYGYLWLGPYSTTTLNIGNNTLIQSGWSRDTTFASHTYNSSGTNLVLKTTGLTTATLGSNPAFTSIGNSMTIGGGSDPSQYYRGHVAEVIIYPTALTGSDASATEDYLADRYDLTW